MIPMFIAYALGFATGALVFRNNAAKISSIEAKAKSIADEFKK